MSTNKYNAEMGRAALALCRSAELMAATGTTAHPGIEAYGRRGPLELYQYW